MSISPWHYDVELTSPNGQIVATVCGAEEVRMGAPTRGTLVLSNGMSFEGVNPSMVWSSDSEYLAIPEWTKGLQQRLLIISMSRRQSRHTMKIYRVLQLESFVGTVVVGVDSPVHMPCPIEVEVSEINWENS